MKIQVEIEADDPKLSAEDISYHLNLGLRGKFFEVKEIKMPTDEEITNVIKEMYPDIIGMELSVKVFNAIRILQHFMGEK